MQERHIYKHVVVAGIDGMGVFNQRTPTPNMDRIFADGAVTYNARSLSPTISAQNWGSMIVGANPEVHGMTNSSTSRLPYSNSALPSVFSRIRTQRPDLKMACMTCWPAITNGMIEPELDIDRVNAPDDQLIDHIVPYLLTEKPNLLFIAFDDVDSAGHGAGFGTPDYLKQVTKTDALVGRVYAACEEAGILDDTLFLVITDHGGIRTGHGGYTPEEYRIFLAANSPYVEKGTIGTACTRDLSAILLYALGLDVPAYTPGGFTAQVPDGIFPEVQGNYQVATPKDQFFASRPTPEFHSEKGLASFIDADRIKLAMFMDNRECDATGKHRLKEIGLVKHYSEGVYGARGEFGITGRVEVPELKLGDGNYSFAVWLRIDRSIDECPVIFATKPWYWKVREGHGIGMALRANDTVLDLGGPDGHSRQEVMIAFPDEVSDGWIHSLVTVDRQKAEICQYYNFKLAGKVSMDPAVNACMDHMTFTVGDDPTGEYAKFYNLLMNMDDFLVFGDALTEADVAKLAEYYHQD